jgi:hypothetical protein
MIRSGASLRLRLWLLSPVTCDMLWEELDYRFGICRVTRGAHIECL